MQPTPKGNRLHIGLFGRRNVGKSSLLNALVRQDVAIVSAEAGTTTDPVEKPMELQPLGPVVFIDTAGIDDAGALGALRVEKTRQVLDRVDLALLVTDTTTSAAGSSPAIGDYEAALAAELDARRIATVRVVNKADLLAGAAPEGAVAVSARTGAGLAALKDAMLARAPAECLQPPSLLSDLVGPGQLAVLVVPIDKEAPKGRLILPQVQSIRELLDGDAMCLVVKERELKAALGRLREPPRLVVTDSQAFLKVAADVPRAVPMTSFSILFARQKGDLAAQVQGAMAVDRLRAGDRVLVAEGCAHHPIGEDIGRVKIPRWMTQYTGAKLDFVHCQGHDFPGEEAGSACQRGEGEARAIGALPSFKLVVHCGACTLNRRVVVNRIRRCAEAGVPVTNYGLVIAYSLGIFERVLEPFPAALEAYRAAKVQGAKA
jgi:[FeFe] hydrogenase H-cluster maturation GTPase HydF